MRCPDNRVRPIEDRQSGTRFLSRVYMWINELFKPDQELVAVVLATVEHYPGCYGKSRRKMGKPQAVGACMDVW